MPNFLRNTTQKLRNIGKNIGNRLTTRRTNYRIAPAPVEELAALEPTAPALSPRQALADLSKLNSKILVARKIQKQFRSRKRLRSKASRKIQSRVRGKQTRKVMDRVKSNMLTNNDCSICLEPLNENVATALPCGHRFHKDCIVNWLSRSQGKCPNCKKRITNIPYPSIQEQERERLYHLQRLISMPTINTINTINRAHELINSMSHARTYDEAVRYMDASSRVINTLPRNGDTYNNLANTQWDTWLEAYRRLSAHTQTRAPITVNGITTAAYNRSTQLDSHPDTGITPAEYNRLIRGMY